MQNIISALGAGSGIDTRALVEQLVAIEKAPTQNTIDSTREKLESQISGFGLIRSAMATFQDAVDALGDPESFNAKSATFSDSDALIPATLEDSAPAGDYTFSVEKIAKAQSLVNQNSFKDPSDAVGKGSLTLRFGQWDGTTDNFTVDADVEAKTITIDDANNSLNGLRDAINDADVGVQASVINDGNGFRLVITAPSGVSNQLEITVDEGGVAADNIDGSGLSQFSFGAGAANQQMLQNQAGVDAELIVNGFTVNRSSNDIDDIVAGFSFNLAKEAPGEVMTISIFDDKAAAQDSVRGFIDAYNTLRDEIAVLTSLDEETNEYGSLHRDTTVSSLMTSLRSSIANAVPGVQGGYTALTNVGIRTALDGSLEIDEDDFGSAFDDNFDLVKSLFAPETTTSSDKVEVSGFGDKTLPGSYEVVVTQAPEQGSLAGAAAAGTLLADVGVATSVASFTGTAPALSLSDLLPVAGSQVGDAATTVIPLNLATLGAGANDYDYTLVVDGNASAAAVSLPVADYASYADMAAAWQSAINADAAISGVVVSYDTDHFVVTSGTTGSTSSVDMTAVGMSAADLGQDIGVATDIPGSGNADDYDFSIVVDGVSSGTVSLTPGSYATFAELASQMQSQINADSALVGAGAEVDVTHNGSEFVISSRLLGTASSVSAVTPLGTFASDLGLDAGTTTAGAGNNYDFTISVNGTSSQTIAIAAATYTNDGLAAELQSRINADTSLQATGAKVEVTYNTSTMGFDIVSTSYGSKSTVSVSSVGANADDLGLASGASSVGKDVAGTVGGETGFGVGNVMLPKLDSDAYGLNFKIKEGAVGSTVTFSRGFGREMSQLIDSFLNSSGLLNNREDGIDRRIEDLDSDQSQLDRRISAYQERLTYQYIAMERIVSSLQGSGSFLDGILDRLPYTANNG